MIIEKINLLVQLFQPLGYTLRIFWDKHFAVVGQAQTMKTDGIELL